MCAAPRPHPLCYCGPSTEAEGVLSGKVRAPQGEQVAASSPGSLTTTGRRCHETNQASG